MRNFLSECTSFKKEKKKKYCSLLSFYGLILAPAAATTPVSQKWKETEVWLSLHAANGDTHSSC